MFFAWKVHTVFWTLLHVNESISIFDWTEALSCYKWAMEFLL